MESVRVEITPGGRASRVEVIVRIPMAIIFFIISEILGIIVAILLFVNIITGLLLAKRVGVGFIKAYLQWVLEFSLLRVSLA